MFPCWVALVGSLGSVACHSASPACPPVASGAASAVATNTPGSNVTGPRNVILLLSDGTGPEAWTLARWVKGNSLNVDGILTGAVRTYGANSIITDSAPGASAYATGKKGSDQGVAVGAWETTLDAVKSDPTLAYVPLATLLEGARLFGYATGLIATSNIQHATPAAFSAHVADRSQYDEIAEQQVYQGIDLVLSGGAQHLLPKSSPGGTRLDGEDLVTVVKQRGYRYVSTSQELKEKASGRVWGAFAPNDLAYEVDRPRFAPNQPSLAEMVDFALANLADSDRGRSRGFFLFVEGSKVDWSAHDNDPVGVVSDLLAFDAAVGNALRYAQSNANTQVIVVADHGTGGITIGTSADPSYSHTDDDSVVGPLRRAKITAERLASLLHTGTSNARIVETIRTEWGIVDLSEIEIARISDAVAHNSGAKSLLARLISQRARIGWSSTGHSGADVLLYAYGPAHPYGLVENTAIGQGIAKFLNLDFERLQRRLFVDAEATLTAHGHRIRMDRSDPHNGQLVVEKGANRARLPWAKNQLLFAQKSHDLEGLVVFADKLNRVFVPQQAIDVLLHEMP